MKQFLLFLFFVPCLLVAQSSEAIKITHGPWLCDMAEDGVTVVWTTNRAAVSWVELAPDDGAHFYAEERPKYYSSANGRIKADQTVHSVRINGLNPGTKYRYRILSQGVAEYPCYKQVRFDDIAATDVYYKKPLAFKTFDSQKNEAVFLMINDIHGDSELIKNLLKNVDVQSLDFILLNGDMSSVVLSEDQLFRDYLDMCVSLFAKEIPIVFTRGNHETRGCFSDKLINYFPHRDNHYYYTFNIGNISFFALDGGEDKPDSDLEYWGLADYDAYREAQALWLKEEIKKDRVKNAAVKIAFLHIPPTIGDWHCNKHLQKTILPLLNEIDVDLMLSGHLHLYSYNEPGVKADFPILVNDNASYVLCTIKNNVITMEIAGANGKVKKMHEIRY